MGPSKKKGRHMASAPGNKQQESSCACGEELLDETEGWSHRRAANTPKKDRDKTIQNIWKVYIEEGAGVE